MIQVLEVDFIVARCGTDGADIRLQNVTATKDQHAQQSDAMREHLRGMHQGPLLHSLSTLILNRV